jgi:hypothetical protein
VLKTVDLQTIAADDITQIDQNDTGVSFSSVTVGTLADGTYEVRIGGDGTVQTATFTVGEAETPSDEYVTVIFGDADNEDGLDSGDITKVARGVAGSTANKGLVGKNCVIDGQTVIFGDADNEDGLDSGDITKVARGVAGSTANKGYVGQDCQVLKTDLQ